MIPDKKAKLIVETWKKYLDDGKKVIDLKKKVIRADEFDKQRREQIEKLKLLILKYRNNTIDILEFKSTLDSENKKNNLWGFSAMKGQMFFNQLVNSMAENIKTLDKIIKETIKQPKNLKDAQEKIKILEDKVNELYEKEEDKRKAPKPSSICYFLSYFWQLYDPEKWPIYYTSMINVLKELNIMREDEKPYINYKNFYRLIEEIKIILSKNTENTVNNWDIEHAFWWKEQNKDKGEQILNFQNTEKFKEMSEYNEYLPPIVADLIIAGKSKESNNTKKGINFEKKVSTLFTMLDFIVEELGQGGRQPDAIATNRENNIAFIIDAKVRPEGYSIGTDDRTIKEYINKYTKKLIKDGYQKRAFIIVSSLFKGEAKQIIDQITIETEIKRMGLVTSEALLYLLAYKLKNNIDISEIANCILKNGIIEGKDIREKFEDV